MPSHLLGFLISFKYEIIFPVAVIEGPIITLVSGFLISLGYLSFVPTYILLFIADMISDSIYYSLGRFGRKYLKKIPFMKNVSDEQFQKLEAHYANHPRKTLIVGKITYGLGGISLATAGASKMSYARFLEYITVPNAARSLILLFIGFYFGTAYRHFGAYLHDYTVAMVTFVVALLLGYWIWTRYRSKEGEEDVDMIK